VDRLRQRQFKRLQIAADREAQALLAALPHPVRAKMRAIPITYQPTPDPALLADGIAPDTLGLFVGEALPDPLESEQQLPAQMLLFLENIWEYAGHDDSAFKEEVRRTLLHELGHFLGLGEDELEDRDLD